MRRARVRARAPRGCSAARGAPPAAVPQRWGGSPTGGAPARGPRAVAAGCNAACSPGGRGGEGGRRMKRRAGGRGAARAGAGAAARTPPRPVQQRPADDRLGARAGAAVAAEQRPAGERGGGMYGQQRQHSRCCEDYAIASHASQPWGSFRRRATLGRPPCPCPPLRLATQYTRCSGSIAATASGRRIGQVSTQTSELTVDVGRKVVFPVRNFTQRAFAS